MSTGLQPDPLNSAREAFSKLPPYFQFVGVVILLGIVGMAGYSITFWGWTISLPIAVYLLIKWFV